MDGLKINNSDAWATYGVMMGDGFLDALLAPVPVKALVQNKSRLEDGKRVLIPSDAAGRSRILRKDERDLTLTFVLSADTPSDFITKKNAFYTMLYGRTVDISFDAATRGTIPTTEVFHLIYTGQSVSYARNIEGTACRITAKFEEPNPAVRS